MIYDLAVIGGGINGCGIARDAAGRGLKVVLLEKGDLASATSGWSSKLIHGGLRYLEQYEFRLVRESLQEREVLLKLAPHIIRPMEFVLPHDASMRPAWMLRAGLFMYDHIGGRISLPRSRSLTLPHEVYSAALKPNLKHGFAYYDAQVDDARLTILNAVAAHEEGARICTQTEVLSGLREQIEGELCWHLKTRAGVNAESIHARGVVNAAGPWVKEVVSQTLGVPTPANVKLVKGSHIVVPRVHSGEHAYILQNIDKRVCFVIPYHDRFTLIGTTDVNVDSVDSGHQISDEEVRYLLRAANRYLATPLMQSDIVWSYAGVRPLYDDGEANAAEITRDYVLRTDHVSGRAPLLSIFGGKITTYRRLAEHALADLAKFYPQMSTAWTHGKVLPGGDIDSVQEASNALARQHRGLPPDYVNALVQRHGSRATRVLDGASSVSDLGERFGAGAAMLTEREIRYALRAEFARGADDILWRRTKCGLQLLPDAREAAAAFIDQIAKG